MKFYIVGAFIGLTICAFTGVPGTPGAVERVADWWNKPLVLSDMAQKVSDLIDDDSLWKSSGDDLLCSIEKENNLLMQGLNYKIPTITHYKVYRSGGTSISRELTDQELSFLRKKALELRCRLQAIELRKVSDQLVKKK